MSNQLIKFVEGELSIREIKELEQQFLENPDLLEVVGSLNRIKQRLSSSQNLHSYFETKKEQLKKHIFDNQRVV